MFLMMTDHQLHAQTLNRNTKYRTAVDDWFKLFLITFYMW